jgi:hypothetical protein
VHLRSADAELLAAKRLARERQVPERWRDEGLQAIEIAGPRRDADWTRAADEIRRAMERGADVI